MCEISRISYRSLLWITVAVNDSVVSWKTWPLNNSRTRAKDYPQHLIIHRRSICSEGSPEFERISALKFLLLKNMMARYVNAMKSTVLVVRKNLQQVAGRDIYLADERLVRAPISYWDWWNTRNIWLSELLMNYRSNQSSVFDEGWGTNSGGILEWMAIVFTKFSSQQLGKIWRERPIKEDVSLDSISIYGARSNHQLSNLVHSGTIQRL